MVTFLFWAFEKNYEIFFQKISILFFTLEALKSY